MIRWLLLLAAAGLPAVCQPRPILFRHVRVFDGTRVMPSAGVLVRGGRIQEIGDNVADPEADLIDGAGKTLLPGLIDAHVHVWSRAALEQALRFGVTTELDMFTSVEAMRAIKAGMTDKMADFRSAGFLATVPGGHGTEYGIKVPTITRPDEAPGWVDDRIREGSDYIKLIFDDGKVYGGPGRPTLSRETMAAVIAAAHLRHKLAVVHIGTLEDARAAIDAGADGLAHLFIGPSSDPGFGTFVAAHHAFVIPTLTVLHSVCGPASPGLQLLSDPHIAPLLSEGDKAALRRGFPSSQRGLSCAGAVQAVKQLEKAGAPILAGTDVPNPGTLQGASLHEELQFLVEAGLSPLEALRAATSAAADAFHLDDRGRIAAGLRADLVLVRGNPAEDILATRDIVAVYKQGIRAPAPQHAAEATGQPAKVP